MDNETILILNFSLFCGNIASMIIERHYCKLFKFWRNKSNILLKEAKETNQAILINIKANDMIYKEAKKLISEHEILEGKFKTEEKKIVLQ